MPGEPISNAHDFDAVLSIIENARGRALKAVNAELIQMYWEVGEYLSGLCTASSFGDKVIDEVAGYISHAAPTVKGFTRRGLYRMKQFYETYRDDEFVSALLTQISWTNHLLILSKARSREERDFYVSLAAREHYSSRELERQLDSAYYERYMLSAGKQPPESVPQEVRSSILDTYVLEFLDLLFYNRALSCPGRHQLLSVVQIRPHPTSRRQLHCLLGHLPQRGRLLDNHAAAIMPSPLGKVARHRRVG